MNQIIAETKIGDKHLHGNRNNQDAVFLFQKDNRCVVAVSDGAGSLEGAKQGAQEIVQRVSYSIFEQFEFIKVLNVRKIADLIAKQIKSCITDLSMEYQMPYQAFGATYLFICMDGEDYLIGHIGDGAILGLLENDHWAVVSFPENGRTSYETYLTTALDLSDHIQLQRGKVNKYKAFLLMTDGMTEAAFESGYVPRCNLPYPELLHRMIKEEHSDDASYIYCERRSEYERLYQTSNFKRESY